MDSIVDRHTSFCEGSGRAMRECERMLKPKSLRKVTSQSSVIRGVVRNFVHFISPGRFIVMEKLKHEHRQLSVCFLRQNREIKDGCIRQFTIRELGIVLRDYQSVAKKMEEREETGADHPSPKAFTNYAAKRVRRRERSKIRFRLANGKRKENSVPVKQKVN